MRKLARTIPVAVLVAMGLMIAPSGASAATTLGEAFTPPADNTGDCLNDQTWLQSASPGAKYAAPFDGVITSWSFQGGASNVPTSVKFKVARNAGLNMFTIVGQSTSITPAVNTLSTNSLQIPVQANDIIGFWSAGGKQCRSAMGYVERRRAGDAALGSTLAYDIQDPLQLDVSAQLESDCDKDGLGDETQDSDISSCAPGTTPTGPAPTLPGGAPATCRGVPATIVGTNGSDVRTGSQGRDVIVALGGNDRLSGLAGNDVICGGPGKDTLKGGAGNDSLLGQKGKDALKGGGGKDFCKGGKGKDTASGCEVKKSI